MTTVKTDLRRFLDAKAKPSRLMGDVERYLLARPDGDRRTDVLHPSEIIKKDFCKRGSYFLMTGHKKIAEKHPMKLQSIFDTGHAIHAKWQKYFQEMGVLHGKFKCVVCDKITWGTSPAECEHCQAPSAKLDYNEVTLTDDDLRIAGHTDGWIKGLEDDCLIEIKSVGPGTIRSEAPQLMSDVDNDPQKAWGNVRRPFPSHVLQGQMYLELMKRMGNPVNEIVFIYEWKADQSFKEFTIRPDFELVRHIFDKAQSVIDSVDAKAVPVCNNNPGGTCKQCSPYKED